jgi:chloramphenicol 3-O-phosphotransferase
MEHGSRAAEGFAWIENARIVPGPVGQRLAAGMRAAVAACARAGNDMLVDDVFVDPGWLDGWRSELAGLEWLLVGVLAPLDVLEERETARGNRIAGEARYQFDRDSQRDRVRRHFGYGTSVARGVRPSDPVGARALTSAQSRDIPEHPRR